MLIAGPKISRATAMVHSNSLGRRIGMVRHARPRLGPERLDDHLLKVTGGIVEIA